MGSQKQQAGISDEQEAEVPAESAQLRTQLLLSAIPDHQPHETKRLSSTGLMAHQLTSRAMPVKPPSASQANLSGTSGAGHLMSTPGFRGKEACVLQPVGMHV